MRRSIVSATSRRSAGPRHRPAGARHRPHRPHRLQRAGFGPPQPHAHGHARPGDAPATAAGSFFGEENVPHQALTMGRRHHPRRRRWCSWPSASTRRRSCGARASRGRSATPSRPATYSNTRRHVPARPGGGRRPDGPAHALDRRPRGVDAGLIRKAVIWLSLKVKKALLKLSDDDFREHELYELLARARPGGGAGPPRLRGVDGDDLPAARRPWAVHRLSSARTPTTT